MDEIEIERITRSNRKTISLEVTDKATLVIKAPYSVSNNAINEVIHRHIRWIRKRISNARTIDKSSEKQFVSGESFLYLGRTYRLFIVKEQTEILRFDNAFYLREDNQPFARDRFIEWYKKTSRSFISERVRFYSNLTGIKYQKVKITSARKRWGSCSREGNLSFTYKLIMAPIFVIDYVVVHELCHILEHNHSKAFWEHVRTILPNYKESKDYLKEKGRMIDL
ncbi:MAG: M48 family metallopeptidase [Caldisericaceae bacterium]